VPREGGREDARGAGGVKGTAFAAERRDPKVLKGRVLQISKRPKYQFE
jgi:hypothetical protein